MRIKLHSPVEGHQVGDVVEVEDGRAEWLVTNGYASTEDAEKQAAWANQMGTTPDKDPLLGAKAEQAQLVSDEEEAPAPKARREGKKKGDSADGE